MKTCEARRSMAIIQSNYIPWIGYFAIMDQVDTFVVYECVQYTKNDWRNRNIVTDSSGEKTWLTIPVRHTSLSQMFRETEIAQRGWARKHFQTLSHKLGRALHWDTYGRQIEALYEEADSMTMLHQVNRLFLEWLVSALGIRSEIIFLENYVDEGDSTRRLISIIKEFGATHYLSGPAARAYMNEQYFADADITLEYVDYDRLIRERTGQAPPAVAISAIQAIIEGSHGFSHHRSEPARALRAA